MGLLTLASGCLYLRYTILPAPGQSVTLMGFLGPGEPTWSRPEADCTPNEDGESGHPYQVFFVQNTSNRLRHFRATADWIDADGFLHVFDNSEEPAMSLAGCIAGNDDDPTILQSRLDDVEIAPGQILLLVASTYEPGASIQKFNLTITTLFERR